MKNISIALILLVVTLASCQKEGNDPDTNSSNNGGNSNPIVYNVNKSTMLQLVNEARQKGCTCGATVMPAVAPLTWNDLLAKAAYDHTKDMYTNKYFSHTGQNGSDPGQRIKAAGYSWSAYGENIASGQTSEQQVVAGWLSSEGHCKNIMNSRFKEIGVGREGNIWTQVFAVK